MDLQVAILLRRHQLFQLGEVWAQLADRVDIFKIVIDAIDSNFESFHFAF